MPSLGLVINRRPTRAQASAIRKAVAAVDCGTQKAIYRVQEGRSWIELTPGLGEPFDRASLRSAAAAAYAAAPDYYQITYAVFEDGEVIEDGMDGLAAQIRAAELQRSCPDFTFWVGMLAEGKLVL